MDIELNWLNTVVIYYICLTFHSYLYPGVTMKWLQYGVYFTSHCHFLCTYGVPVHKTFPTPHWRCSWLPRNVGGPTSVSLAPSKLLPLSVLWLKRLAAGLSPLRPGLAPGVDKRALCRGFLRVFQFTSVNVIPQWLYILIYHLGDVAVVQRHRFTPSTWTTRTVSQTAAW
jgi:hypothetical protein